MSVADYQKEEKENEENLNGSSYYGGSGSDILSDHINYAC
jgi:hypothetical protein